MPEITLEFIAKQQAELIEAVRGVQAELSAMRAEIDGGFHMMRGTDERVEGLRRIVDGYGQRITALEKSRR